MSKFTIEKYHRIDTQLKELISKNKTAKEIGELLKVSQSTIFRRCKHLNITIPNYHNNLKFDNTVFDSIDTEEKAYWLGFLYADGNVHSTQNVINITLSGKDKDHLMKFNTFIKNKTSIKEYDIIREGKIYSCCRLCICDKHLKNQLISLGCVPRKSLTLKFPNINIFENTNLVYDFIRGYVDGDGCLTFSRNGRLSISILGTYEFLLGIKSYFPNNFKEIHKIKRLITNTYVINNCGYNADIVCSKLYKNAKIYLERKYNRFVVLGRNI